MSEKTNNAQIEDLIAELDWRGLIKDATDKEALRDHLSDPKSTPRKIYAGFDPTADSLTIGNLVPIMMLAHVKRAGHVPVVVMGGGTGLIGDPSGKSAERQMMTAETVQANVDRQRPIFENVLGQIDGPEHEIKNNLSWLGGISYIEALRDIGKHFSVNMMMQKESVRERLNNREQGISYTEFSYMILQAYDFAYLYEHDGVTVQFGGSDQYGNIVAGSDLIRRMNSENWESDYEALREEKFGASADEIIQLVEEWTSKSTNEVRSAYSKYVVDSWELLEKIDTRNSREADRIMKKIDQLEQQFYLLAEQNGAPDKILASQARMNNVLKMVLDFGDAYFKSKAPYGLTAPLVQKADGGKFGKTESGAVWLTAARTSAYAYYQFWLNATDEDARNWIKIFTLLPQGEVEALIARHDENPGMRELQRTLAQHATQILHGQGAMENAEAAGKALFSGEIASLDKDTLVEVFASVPTTHHAKSELDGEGVDPMELLKSCNLASSNREAREFLSGGSVSVNGEKIDGDTRITASHLLHGSFIAIRRGKKNWHLTKWA